MIAKCVTEINRRAPKPIVDAMQIFHIINTHAYFSLASRSVSQRDRCDYFTLGFLCQRKTIFEILINSLTV